MAQHGAKTTDAAAHEVTVGVSLGDSRELRFKHLELLGAEVSGRAMGCRQKNPHLLINMGVFSWPPNVGKAMS